MYFKGGEREVSPHRALITKQHRNNYGHFGPYATKEFIPARAGTLTREIFSNCFHIKNTHTPLTHTHTQRVTHHQQLATPTGRTPFWPYYLYGHSIGLPGCRRWQLIPFTLYRLMCPVSLCPSTASKCNSDPTPTPTGCLTGAHLFVSTLGRLMLHGLESNQCR